MPPTSSSPQPSPRSRSTRCSSAASAGWRGCLGVAPRWLSWPLAERLLPLDLVHPAVRARYLQYLWSRPPAGCCGRIARVTEVDGVARGSRHEGLVTGSVTRSTAPGARVQKQHALV